MDYAIVPNFYLKEILNNYLKLLSLEYKFKIKKRTESKVKLL